MLYGIFKIKPGPQFNPQNRKTTCDLAILTFGQKIIVKRKVMVTVCFQGTITTQVGNIHIENNPLKTH